jgi:hypothetical protein
MTTIAQEILFTGRHTQGCIVPVTTEDPDLIILETNPDSTKWGILFFLGQPIHSNCIAVINDNTDLTKLHHSIFTAPVVTKNGNLLGSVSQRIMKHQES